MSNSINYNQLTNFLKEASLFEIYRFQVALQNEMENPQRIADVRKQFKEGDAIEYFDRETNALVRAVVKQKNQKRITAVNCVDGKIWTLPYYMLKLDGRDFVFSQPNRGLNKNAVKVGDWVGWNYDGEEVIGKIKRLNHKTVTMTTKKYGLFRVYYESLYSILEGEQGTEPSDIQDSCLPRHLT